MVARWQDVLKLLSLFAARLNAQSDLSSPRQFGGLLIRGTGINTTTTPFIARSHLRYGSGASTSTFYTSAVTPFNVTGEIIPLFSQFAPPAEADCDPSTWGLSPAAFQGKIVFTFFTYLLPTAEARSGCPCGVGVWWLGRASRALSGRLRPVVPD